MSVPDGTGFRLISKVIEKFRSPSTALMVYAELKESVKSNSNVEIEPGNYLMYIDNEYLHGLESYKLVIVKNGAKYYCSIYDVLKTSLVEDL